MRRHSWENFSTIQSVVKNHDSLTLKQMFDVTAQLVNDQEEVHGLDKVHWEKISWRRLSLVMKKFFNLQRTKSLPFQILCCASGGSSA